MRHAATLIETIRRQRAGFLLSRGAETPFYAACAEEMIADVERDGPATRVLAPFADAAFDQAYVLRYLAGLHRLALSGDSAELAAHFPSTGGDGDAHAAMRSVATLMDDLPPMLLDALTRPPQTNEVGRAAALASALLVVADRYSRPLCLREIGSSAGLNLRLDSYWYEHEGKGWGDERSPVRFVDLWRGGAPPFGTPAEIADRRGCDRNPIDTTDPEGALNLLSYVWPEPRERFDRAHAAMDIAARHPVSVDRADAREWLPAQLADRRPGAAMVVFHSVFWQYLDDDSQRVLVEALTSTGQAATRETPLAWVRLEPHPVTFVPNELRLTCWDGTTASGDDTLLATTGFHGGAIEWLGRDDG